MLSNFQLLDAAFLHFYSVLNLVKKCPISKYLKMFFFFEENSLHASRFFYISIILEAMDFCPNQSINQSIQKSETNYFCQKCMDLFSCRAEQSTILKI